MPKPITKEYLYNARKIFDKIESFVLMDEPDKALKMLEGGFNILDRREDDNGENTLS